MTEEVPIRSGGRDGKRLIHLGVAAFLVTCVVLFLFGGLLLPGAHSEPRFRVHETARASADGTFQVTLDTSDRKHWVHFDLGAGSISTVSADRKGPGDLLLRRHALGAPHGAMKLGKVPLAAAHRPPAGASWVNDTDVGGERQNPALGHWYGYSYATHVLRSSGETYAVRLAGGAVALLNIVSYYCEPEGSGCLTLRYRLELEGG